MSNKKLSEDLEKSIMDKIVKMNIFFAESSMSIYKMPVCNDKIK